MQNNPLLGELGAHVSIRWVYGIDALAAPVYIVEYICLNWTSGTRLRQILEEVQDLERDPQFGSGASCRRRPLWLGLYSVPIWILVTGPTSEFLPLQELREGDSASKDSRTKLFARTG